MGSNIVKFVNEGHLLVKIIFQLIIFIVFSTFFLLEKRKHKIAIKLKKLHHLTGNEALQSANWSYKLTKIIYTIVFFLWVISWFYVI